MSRLFYKNNVLFELYVKLKLRSTDAEKKFVLPLLVYPPPPLTYQIWIAVHWVGSGLKYATTDGIAHYYMLI
jgi:hypothetical protein